MVAFLLALPARAEPAPSAAVPPRVTVKAGQHRGFLRLAFTWPRAPGHSLSVEGERVVLRFGQPGTIALGPLQQRLPRNVAGLEVLPDGVALRLLPGVRARVLQVGKVTALDLADPPAAGRAARTAAVERQAPVPLLVAPPMAAAPPPQPAAAAPAPAPAPLAAARHLAHPASPPPAGPSPASPAEARRLRLPFPAGTGAAAVERGGALILAFDAVGEPDLPAIRRLAPGLAEATAEQRRTTTVIRLPLAAAGALRLTTEDGAWTLVSGMAEAPAVAEPAIEVLPGDRPRQLLRTASPGRVVPLPDPEGDGLLQLGTVLIPLPGMAAPHGSPAFTLLPTRLGAALLPRAEEVTLKAAAEGFIITLPAGAAQAGLPAPATEALLDLPDLPLPQLLLRRHEALAAAAAAPVQARGQPRLALTEALFGLGLAAETHGLVQAAMEEDPRLEMQPKALLLLGAAALLAGRTEEAAAALGNPRLDPMPEALLWRGLLADGPAAEVAAHRGTLQRYPAPLRDRVLPLAVDALVEAGRLEEAAALLRLPGLARSPRLAFAEARLLEARQKVEPALAAYGLLAAGRDRDIRARAMQRAAELRLATGRDDASRAASAMAAAAVAWRGDARELALRQRAAALHLEAGEAAAALTLLRETETLFPEAGESLRGAIAAALPLALADPALSPPAAARLVEQWPDPLPPIGAPPLAALANRLQALDLQPQAAALLRRALAQPMGPEERAALGLQLAQALHAAGEHGAAVETLREVPADALSGSLRTVRTSLEADLLRLAGDATGLRALGQEGAAPLAELLAAREDWGGAAEALAGLAVATLPPAPAPLDAAQRTLLLRLAAFTGLAGDEAGLARLRAAYGPRFAGGPLAGAFATVTAATGAAGRKPNLQQLQEDIAAARALQEQMRSLQ